jgi:fermentation-respiration switch protein FrsA (DUF1100 family)
MKQRKKFLLIAVVLAIATAHPCYGQELTKSDAAAETKAPSIDELLLFFPSKFPAGDWNPKDLQFHDVFFAAEDGTKLHGWYCPADNPRAVVLVSHGNAGHVASRAPWLRLLQTKTRVSVFMFDYRGYGRSEGTPTVAGVIQDATAARAKLCELAGVKNSELLLMGESLGGAVAVQLAADSPPRGLILQSAFSSLRDVADVHYPKLSWLVPRNKFNSVKQIVHYRGPLLQSHGSEDRTIPFSSGEKLFRAANEPKQFVTIEDADHNNWLTDAYLKQLDGFLTRVTVPQK